MLVVGFYTPGYRSDAIRLMRSLDRLDITHDIMPIADIDGGLSSRCKYCNARYRRLRRQLKKLGAT